MHWILLRGLTREAAHWGSFATRLQAALGQPVVCVDLPGTGVHWREASPRSIPAIREALQVRLASIPPPYGVVALSMGGMVALDWAQQALPGGLSRLVLINTSTGFSLPWQRLQLPAWRKILPMLLQSDTHQREAAILALSSARPLPEGLVAAWQAIQQARPVSRVTALRQMVAAARFVPGATAPGVPALLLASRGDRLVSWRCSETLSNRWNWPLRLHPDAGHDLPLDEPEWVLDAILQWLKTV